MLIGSKDTEFIKVVTEGMKEVFYGIFHRVSPRFDFRR